MEDITKITRELAPEMIASLDALSNALDTINRSDVFSVAPDGSRHAWAIQSDSEPYGLVHMAARAALESLTTPDNAQRVLDHVADTQDPLSVAYVAVHAEQDARIAELWRELLDSHRTDVRGPSEYGSGSWPQTVDAERLAELIASNGEPADSQPVEITLASYGDYGGAVYDASNVRDLDGYTGVETSTGGHWGEGRAWIMCGALPMVDGDDITDGIENLSTLVDMIHGLEDYPIISEDTLYEVEQELQDESWDGWLESDVMGDLRQMLEDAAGDDWDSAPDPSDRAAEVREAYYSFEDNEWVCETATSAVNMRHDAALQHVASTLFGLTPFWVILNGDGQTMPGEFDSEDAARRAMYVTLESERVAGKPAPYYRTRITARS